jgi:hypothetical protein
LVRLYQSSLQLPGPLPIVASASLKLLSSPLHREHINHIQVLGSLPFPYFSHVCCPLSVWPMSNNITAFVLVEYHCDLSHISFFFNLPLLNPILPFYLSSPSCFPDRIHSWKESFSSIDLSHDTLCSIIYKIPSLLPSIILIG